ncbi:hypothetical protein ABD91_19525 [Lysinibacillus sphaericus]|nr:hypothetical protein [Lysinibacillus sphaericus]
MDLTTKKVVQKTKAGVLKAKQQVDTRTVGRNTTHLSPKLSNPKHYKMARIKSLLRIRVRAKLGPHHDMVIGKYQMKNMIC